MRLGFSLHDHIYTFIFTTPLCDPHKGRQQRRNIIRLFERFFVDIKNLLIHPTKSFILLNQKGKKKKCFVNEKDHFVITDYLINVKPPYLLELKKINIQW